MLQFAVLAGRLSGPCPVGGAILIQTPGAYTAVQYYYRSCANSCRTSHRRGGGGDTADRGGGVLPLPRHTSAKWQPDSPGSLQNSTTSRQVVSGVMGTSVRTCSLSLRYTVRIIWEGDRESDQVTHGEKHPPLPPGTHTHPLRPHHHGNRSMQGNQLTMGGGEAGRSLGPTQTPPNPVI